MRARHWVGAAVVIACAPFGCNAIFGIEPGNLVDASADSSSDVIITDAGSEAEAAATDADAGPNAYWMFTSTDFVSNAEVTVVTPSDTNATAFGRFKLPSGDALANGSRGRAFVINRTTGDVFVLDKTDPGNLTKVTRIHTMLGLDGGPEPSDPYAVVMVDDQKG